MESWEQHKDVLRAQYSSKTLQSLMVHMEANFSFIKSKGQYERQFKKWGFSKNSTSEDWKTLHGKIQKRQTQGKKSDVYKSGKLVRVEKLNKEKRHNFRKLGEASGSRPPAANTCCVESYCRHAIVELPKTPEGYTVCTPMCGEAAPPLLIHNLPFFQLFGQLKSFISAPKNASQHIRQRNADNLRGNSQAASSGTGPQTHWSFDKQIMRSASNEGTVSTEISSEEDRDDGSDLDLILSKEWKLDGTNLKDLFQVSRTGELSPLILPMLHQASNNLLPQYEASEVVNAIRLGGGRRVFGSLISTRSPATQAIARSLLSAALGSLDVELVRSLLNTGLSPDTHVGYDLKTPLQFALAEVEWDVGILDLTQLLLDHGAQINPTCATYTYSPLVYAARHCHFGLVQLLLTAGADINAHASTGETKALQAAAGAILYQSVRAPQAVAESDRFEVAQLLLNAGADVNARPERESFRETALQAAVRHENVALVEMLLLHGADVNAPAIQRGETALQSAASTGNLEMIDLLLTWGALDVSNAIASALEQGHSQVARLLMSFGPGLDDAEIKAHKRLALGAGIRSGDYHVVQGLLNSGVDLEARTGEHQTTALQEAAMKGNIDLVCLLISFGADVNAFAGGRDGETALQIAAQAGSIELVRLLLDAGADVNSDPSEYGMMALESAVAADSVEMVQLLLDAGADTYIQGAAAIMIASSWQSEPAKRNSPEIVQLLLDHLPSSGVYSEHIFDSGIDYTIDRELMPVFLQYGVFNDDFALRHAIAEGDIDLVELALDFGADVNAGQESIGERWILEEAVAIDGLEVMQLLLEHGANSLGKARALQFAAYDGSFRDVELLIRAGGDVNAAPLHYCIYYGQTERRTALQAAAQQGHLHVVRLLLEAGAEVERSSISEHEQGTALQFAAMSGSIAIANELIQRGANVNAGPLGENGRTALEGAAEHGRLDMVQLLLNLEAEVRGSRALQFARKEGHDGVAMLLLQNGFEDDVGMSG